MNINELKTKSKKRDYPVNQFIVKRKENGLHKSGILLLVFSLWSLTAQAYVCVVDTDGDGMADGTAGATTSLFFEGEKQLACGSKAAVTGLGSTAVGADSKAHSTISVALGRSASVTGDGSIALGVNSSAAGFLSSAVGLSANVDKTSETGIAMGAGAKLINAFGGIAVGYNAKVANALGAIAIGSDANLNGTTATATAPGAIAIGDDVVANKANTMTVGVPIEVKRDDGSTQILIKENIGDNSLQFLQKMVCQTCTPGFMLRQNIPSNLTWLFRMRKNGDFIIDDPATKRTEVNFRSGGDLQISGTLTQASSRDIKTNIKELEAEDVLSKLDQLPISKWSYKKDAGKVMHIGPMAEDFYALFNVGSDNKSLSSIDTSGVALAAIKALKQDNEKIRAEKDKQIARLNDQIDAMQVQLSQVDDLKQMLANITVLTNSMTLTNVEP